MKKEDLLLVFEFLATALKQDVVEEKSKDKPYKFEDYFPDTIKGEPEVVVEDKGGYNKSEPIPEEVVKAVEDFKQIRKETKFDAEKWHDDFNKEKSSTEVLPTDNQTVKIIKTEATRIKQIMDMIDAGDVFPYRKSKTPEKSIDKILKEHQEQIAMIIRALEFKLLDTIATPEQKRVFKKFVQMENFKANKDLEQIDYFLNNPEVENPYEGEEDEIKPNSIEKVLTTENLKTLMTVVPSNEPATVKFKEEYKHGLGPDKKFGFDGQEIKE